MRKKIGTVYLIHFDRPLYHACHYIGFTELTVEERMKQHRKGYGAKIMKAVEEAGIGWYVVRVWENVPQSFERYLKNQKNSKRYCPVCGGNKKGDDL